MFDWFIQKKNILTTSLLMGMTDIHSHLLPGVDDGVQTSEETIQILNQLRDTGIKRMYLTPHIMHDYPLNNRTNLETAFTRLIENIPSGIELRLAAEYMLDADFESHLKLGLLTLGNKFVLVETSYLAPPPEFEDILYNVVVEGYIPVIAHPERYVYMSPSDYICLKEKGYMLQMNLFSIGGYYGHQAMKNAIYLLKEGLYDFTGSDIHSIEKYNKGLQKLNITSRQQKAIKELIHNNESLW